MKKRKLKPQVKAILIILGIIFAFIFLENGIKAVNNLWNTFKAEREYNKQQELYEKTPMYQEQKYVAESIEKTLEYIHEENYEKIFSLLDPDYKEVFEIDSIEKLKVVLKEYLGDNPQDVTLLDYGMQNGRYICKVAVKKEGVVENKELLVTPLFEDDFYIVLDNVRTIEKNTDPFFLLKGDIEYFLKYKVVKGDERILIFDVKNKTSNIITASYEESTLRKTNRKTYPLINTEELKNVKLLPNEEKRISFIFDNKDSYIFPDEMMYFNLLLEDGTKINQEFIMRNQGDY